MTLYRVMWEIDIDASSPEEAVDIAIDIQQDPESTALCFAVAWEGNKKIVDLCEEMDPDQRLQ